VQAACTKEITTTICAEKLEHMVQDSYFKAAIKPYKDKWKTIKGYIHTTFTDVGAMFAACFIIIQVVLYGKIFYMLGKLLLTQWGVIS